MVGESVYVYNRQSLRPVKRRRVIVEDDLSASFEARIRLCRETWLAIEQGINGKLHEVYRATVAELEEYINSSQAIENRLPVGIIDSEHNATAFVSLFEQLRLQLTTQKQVITARLEASSSTNLKTLLKSLNQEVIQDAALNYDEEEPKAGPAKGPKLVNYDLRLLQRHCTSRDIHHVIIALSDGDSVDPDTLSSFISILSSSHHRLRFTLLLSVNSSVSMLADRLPRTVRNKIQTRAFKLAPATQTLDRVLESVVVNRDALVHPGASLVRLLLLRQHEHGTSVDSMVQSLKYAYMSHFYGNPVSVFLDETTPKATFNETHFAALRALSSFRTYCETLMQSGRSEYVQSLLDNDQALFDCVRQNIQFSCDKLVWSMAALQTTRTLQTDLGLRTSPFAELYTEMMTGEFHATKSVRELLLRIKLASPSEMNSLLDRIRDTLLAMPPSELELSPDHFEDLMELLAPYVSQSGEPVPLSSAQPGTSRKKTLTEGQQLWANVQQSCCESIASYFQQTSYPYESMFLHEVLFYSLTAPHREAFNPKIRLAVERALSTPQDYLACSCCMDAKDGLSPAQPPISVLYQLYLESGSLINIYDLFSAFDAVVKHQYEDEQLIKALFFRSIAELRGMGFIKPSPKKIDHVAKITWKGL